MPTFQIEFQINFNEESFRVTVMCNLTRHHGILCSGVIVLHGHVGKKTQLCFSRIHAHACVSTYVHKYITEYETGAKFLEL